MSAQVDEGKRMLRRALLKSRSCAPRSILLGGQQLIRNGERLDQALEAFVEVGNASQEMQDPFVNAEAAVDQTLVAR